MRSLRLYRSRSISRWSFFSNFQGRRRSQGKTYHYTALAPAFTELEHSTNQSCRHCSYLNNSSNTVMGLTQAPYMSNFLENTSILTLRAARGAFWPSQYLEFIRVLPYSASHCRTFSWPYYSVWFLLVYSYK